MKRSDTLTGIGLMLLGMVGLSMADTFIKLLSPGFSPAMTLTVTGFATALCFAIWAKAQGAQILSRDLLRPVIILRNLCEMIGSGFLVTALATNPLAVFSAIFQATPLLVTFGAALFFGAAVGPRRWAAILIGFVGVLIIIRPGSSDFDANALFAVGAAVFLAGRDLCTRATPAHIKATTLSIWSSFAVGIIGLLLLPFAAPSTAPDLPAILFTLGATLCVVGGIYCVTTAMRLGDIPTISPFRYARIVFTLILAMLIFGERPDVWTLIGAAIVVASGLYTFWREAKTL